ncbi:protein of unknown function [Cyanobium sp. NIES-981]|nr:protein of unknown function [Cyanobium sp. NIES-981]
MVGLSQRNGQPFASTNLGFLACVNLYGWTISACLQVTIPLDSGASMLLAEIVRFLVLLKMLDLARR